MDTLRYETVLPVICSNCLQQPVLILPHSHFIIVHIFSSFQVNLNLMPSVILYCDCMFEAIFFMIHALCHHDNISMRLHVCHMFAMYSTKLLGILIVTYPPNSK